MKGFEENRIRALRVKRGLSGQAVADKMEVSVQYLYDLERGKRTLSAELAGKLADYFKVTTDYLLMRTDLNHYQNKNNPDAHEESELSEIPIEKLNTYNLTYKGHALSEEEANDVIELLEAALKRWKK